jgi:hypothetical protein
MTAPPTVPETSWSSKLYWLAYHLRTGTAAWLRRHKVGAGVLLILLGFLLFFLRAWVQPYAVALRIHLFPVLLMLAAYALVIWIGAKRKWFGALGFLVVTGLVVGYIASKGQAREYLALYAHYRSLPMEDLAQLPLTDYERIQPRHSIRVLARESMTEVQQATDPQMVRDGDGYAWVMGVEPSFTIPRLTGEVSEVIAVSATAPSPNFSAENRSDVRFVAGEELYLGKQIRRSIVRRFGLLKFFTYEPAELRYARTDDGEWVQLVPLVRWKGFFFPKPVFGGVVVVRQDGSELMNLLLGQGQWIRPEAIAEEPWLSGQNLMPNAVSRFTAHSFRFQAGFLAPLPGYHRGDIRIPDLAGDFNDQPFTIFCRFEDSAKLYHYFALEPFQEDKQGLNTSVFVPTDGLGSVLVYRHHERGEALAGVSTVAAKVQESRKYYDWSQSAVVEQRPVIRDIAGERRFFWLSTVVTRKSAPGETNAFIAGSVPDVTLTDATYKSVVWVDGRKPAEWSEQLASELAEVWKH